MAPPARQTKSAAWALNTSTVGVSAMAERENAAGGYLIFDPDWKPVVWTQAERGNRRGHLSGKGDPFESGLGRYLAFRRGALVFLVEELQELLDLLVVGAEILGEVLVEDRQRIPAPR
jgi:hypothetical protein